MQNEEFGNIIALNDEDGNEINFELLDIIEYKGAEYVVLYPENDEESTDVVILRMEDGDSEDISAFVGIDDEETLMAVFEIFKERFEAEFEVIE